MTIEAKFSLAQKVWIPELKVTGRIKALYLSVSEIGVQYYVRFFRESGLAGTEYFFEDEITAEIPAANPAGFQEAPR